MIFLNFNNKLIPIANISEIERVETTSRSADDETEKTITYGIRCFYLRNGNIVLASEAFPTVQDQELRWMELSSLFEAKQRSPFCNHERCDHHFILEVRSDYKYQVRCGRCSVVYPLEPSSMLVSQELKCG